MFYNEGNPDGWLKFRGGFSLLSDFRLLKYNVQTLSLLFLHRNVVRMDELTDSHLASCIKPGVEAPQGFS